MEASVNVATITVSSVVEHLTVRDARAYHVHDTTTESGHRQTVVDVWASLHWSAVESKILRVYISAVRCCRVIVDEFGALETVELFPVSLDASHAAVSDKLRDASSITSVPSCS